MLRPRLGSLLRYRLLERHELFSAGGALTVVTADPLAEQGQSLLGVRDDADVRLEVAPDLLWVDVHLNHGAALHLARRRRARQPGHETGAHYECRIAGLTQ